MNIRNVILLVGLLFSSTVFGQKDVDILSDLPLLKGLYLGQNPPGDIPMPFAPGIISKKGWEVEGVFSPRLDEFYFTVNKKEYENTASDGFEATIIGLRMVNNIWQKHQQFKRNGEITFSPDGNIMHMAKGYKERINNTWSERKLLDTIINRKEYGIMRLSASNKGSYVFDDYKSKGVIRISKMIDKKRHEPERLNAHINSGKKTAHPFIAPDESYIIWDSEREGGYGDSDLYISFKQNYGSWGPAINLGDKINTDKWEAFGTITSDGKYLFFNRNIGSNEYENVDIMWVDVSFIENLRKRNTNK